MERLKILHIEDVPSDAELVDRMLKRSGIEFEKVIVDTRDEYLDALGKFRPDVILSDHSLPAFNSLEALKILKQHGKDIPFILITATVSEEFAVSVMQEGASDYVLKDRLQRLPNAIINALAKLQSETEKQRYLNKIVASEALFKKAESIAGFGTWRYDLKKQTMDWSAGTYPLLGYDRSDIRPSVEVFLKNVIPDDIPGAEEIFKSAGKIKTGDADFRIRNSQGNLCYIHSQFETEFNEKGQPEYLAGFNQDVTRSRLAQLEIQQNLEEIQAAAERQSSILNALQPHVVLLNESGKIVAVNESWKKFTIKNNLGIPRYGIDYSYLAVSEKATGADHESINRLAHGIREVTAGDADKFSLEYSFYEKKKKVWYQIIVVPLRNKTNKGAVVLHIDITERKVAEELLLQSEANLKTIFENTDTAYVLFNTDNRIVSFNSQATNLCMRQFNKKLKVGGSALSYFPKNKTPNVRAAIRNVMAGGSMNYETNYQMADGSSIWYEVMWIGVADEHKNNIGFILAFKDITERKTTELLRDQMTADLAQRYRALEQFTYIVSHNLRAPVANIMGLSNILNSFDFNLTERDDVLKALETSISVLDQIIIDLNVILEVHNSGGHEKNEPVSFQAIVNEINHSIDSMIKREQATVITDFEGADSASTVKGYMYSIFYNLISNGIKYRRPDVAPVVSITSVKKNNKIELTFKDNGKGIEENHMKNLFGLYKRFDTSVEGKGMGLFMVKMQVEKLGGKIIVQSKPGSGTVFKLELPID